MVQAPQVPEIVTFQLDASSVGKLRNTVNLFRADVTLTQALFRMPGRDSDPSLSVSVTLLYESNVFWDAVTWNRDAPTGVAAS